MLKNTKVILFVWKDDMALALTRQINREYAGSADLNGARIELDFDATKDQIMECVRNCNTFHSSLPRGCGMIEYSDVSYRRVEHSLVDLVLTESPKEDLVRINAYH